MPKLLTDLAIERFKPGTKRREIADTNCPGLSIIIQPSGAKSWAYRYRYARRLRRITIGNYPVIDLVKARRRAEQARAAVEKGINPIALFAPKSSQHISTADRDSFGVLIRTFFLKHAIPHTRSWRETARLIGLKVEEQEGKKTPIFSDVKDGIVERWAEKPVGNIKRSDIREMIEASKERGATTTANREVAAVRKFFAWCIENEIIELNPAAGMAKASPENKRTRLLSDAEIRVIWLAAEADGYPFGDMVRLLMLTAQRRGEASGALRSEINAQAREWVIPKERTKNGLPHLVPLSDAAIDILDNAPRFAGSDYVFGASGHSGFKGYSKAKRRLDAAIAELNGGPLPQWGLHDLRRTAATGMARLGVLPHVVEAVLNHISGTKAGVAGIYNLWSYEAEKRAALDLWAAHVLAISDPDAGTE